jgi:HD superfamily phosphodiesterase
MNKLTKTQIKKIKEFARKFYQKLDEMHGVDHANRTVKLAEYLAKKEDANVQIARLGALLHQFHNGKIVDKFLRKLKVDEEIIKQLVHCVECSWHTNISKARTIEAKVVYDADKLQVIGPFGIIREFALNILGVYKKLKFRDALKQTKTMEGKLFKTLQTKTAKNLAKKPHQFILKFWKIFNKWDKVKL